MFLCREPYLYATIVMNPFISIINFIKSILNIGVDQDQEPHHRIIIQVINLIFTIVLLVVLLGFINGFAATGNLVIYLGNIGFLLVCVFGLYLNHRKEYDGATTLATVGTTTVMFFNVFYHEIDGSRADMIFLPLAVAAPLAFRKRWMGIAAFIYIATLLAVILWNANMRNIGNFSAVYTTLLIAGGMVISTATIIKHLERSAIELRQNNQQLKAQNKKQEELLLQNKLKTELLGILSHDLKGPAAAFNQLSKKVAYLLRKERYADIEKFGASFEVAGDKIFQDIDRLLNWTISQKENIVIRDNEFIPYTLVQRLTENIAFQLKDKNVVFKNNLPEDFPITTDSHLLEIILKNILNNAATHIEDGEQVSITHTVLDNTISISIHNPGAPIDKATVEQAKAGKYRKSAHSQGLGLGICFSLIQFIEGTISFDTESKPGTTAVVALPIK